MTDYKTTVDWFRFRAQAEPRDILEALRPMFWPDGDALRFNFQNKGILGFQKGAIIEFATMPIGRADWGGDSQKGWVRVDINGKGCEWVKDWDTVADVEKLTNAQIRRVDLALTTWNGEVNHDQVVKAHGDGWFVTNGSPPVLTQITSSDPRAGRTCYIGKRERSDKFMRCYEKGFEMASKFSRPVAEIDGKAVEGIYRCEVEFKASNSIIPWDVIDHRDQYFSGSYPFCTRLLPGIESDILMRRRERAPQTDLASALDHCRTQFGPSLYTALRAYGGDIGAVWDKVCGDHHSADLVAAGVLLVEH